VLIYEADSGGLILLESFKFDDELPTVGHVITITFRKKKLSLVQCPRAPKYTVGPANIVKGLTIKDIRS